MNHAQEQSDEVEALQSIFMEDFEVVDTAPHAFNITLQPTAPGSDAENHVTAILRVKFSAQYPEKPLAELKVENVNGLSERQVVALQQMAAKSAADGLGQAVIYTLCDALKEQLLAWNVKEKTMHESMMERANQKQEKEDELKRAEEEKLAAARELKNQKKVYVSPIKPGTLVTLESFAAWKKTFDVEIKALNDAKEKEKAAAQAGQPVKHTGREIFQKNLVKSLGLEEDGQGKEGEEVFWYNDDVYDEEVDPDAASDDDDAPVAGAKPVAASTADGKGPSEAEAALAADAHGDDDADADADADDTDSPAAAAAAATDAKAPAAAAQSKSAAPAAAAASKPAAAAAAAAAKPAAAAAPAAAASLGSKAADDAKRRAAVGTAAPPPGMGGAKGASATKPAAAPAAAPAKPSAVPGAAAGGKNAPKTKRK